jgi:2-polyprenyl-3-methyl-5-hydroxy-6-metoxy-1,4-benzoquinol methylase
MCVVSESPESHWERIYRSRPADELSWFQTSPTTSVRLVEAAVPGGGSVLDVGAGSSSLVDVLLSESFEDLTVLDVSGTALDAVRTRLAERGQHVHFVQADLLDWEPVRTFDVWHDRAVFHFLTGPEDRSRYVHVAAAAVRAAGTLIVATFASDGPTHCSGLPVSRYDAGELAAEFETSFDLVHSEREEHCTPAGVVQPFTWAVLRRR